MSTYMEDFVARINSKTGCTVEPEDIVEAAVTVAAVAIDVKNRGNVRESLNCNFELIAEFLTERRKDAISNASSSRASVAYTGESRTLTIEDYNQLAAPYADFVPGFNGEKLKSVVESNPEYSAGLKEAEARGDGEGFITAKLPDLLTLCMQEANEN